MANSEDPNQKLHSAASDLCLVYSGLSVRYLEQKTYEGGVFYDSLGMIFSHFP